MRNFLPLILMCVAICTNAQVPQAVEDFVNDTALENANVGLYIKEVSTGIVVADYNGKTNMIPASVTKLISTATALEMLSDTFTFETNIVMEGKLTPDSVLKGDIYIVGGGDPTLESAYMQPQENFFEEACLSIAEKGIKCIEGGVIGDASLFHQVGAIPQWLVEDIGTYYATTPSAICAYDNLIRIHAGIPEGDTNVKLYRTIPHTNLFSLSFENKKCEYKIYAADYSWVRTIQGPFTPGKKVEITAEMPEPALFVADSIESRLMNMGISIANPPSTTRRTAYTKSDSCILLYKYKSQPLSLIAKQTNYRSINLYAENIFLYLSTLKGGIASHHNSSSVVASFWNKNGVNAKSIHQVDGSGLSMKNSINPAFLVDMLVYMKAKSKYAKAFYTSLPICGVNGTVKGFMSGTPLAGKAHFKSGSMDRVQNYAGYIEYGGKTYAVAIMINGFNCARADLKSKMSKMFNTIFQ